MVYTRSCYLGIAKRSYQQGASFRLGQTLELHEKLLDPTDTWTVPYEEL